MFSDASSAGAARLVGKARELRLESGATEPAVDVVRCIKAGAGARDGARDALSFAAGLGVMDLGAGLLVRDARFAVEGLNMD